MSSYSSCASKSQEGAARLSDKFQCEWQGRPTITRKEEEALTTELATEEDPRLKQAQEFYHMPGSVWGQK